MWLEPILRWIHILAGVMWIGLLWFFNFVNTDATKLAAASGEAAPIGKYIVPRALFFFRWSALATWVFGAALLSTVSVNGLNGFSGAFAFWQWGMHPAFAAIGMGAWLGTIMLFNVWALIWRNQKKILGFVPATDAEKARARRVSGLASRVNTLLSIPMLFFMATGPHALFISQNPEQIWH
ncbi:MAG: urate hydroxylase PuuD [Candidatus Tyrphobacter sp.]